MSERGNALLMLLGKSKPGGADEASPGKGPSEDYDGDLKVALGDLAAALGVKLVDAKRGVEAIKTMHDLCSRAEESGEGE